MFQVVFGGRTYNIISSSFIALVATAVSFYFSFLVHAHMALDLFMPLRSLDEGRQTYIQGVRLSRNIRLAC